MKRSGFKSKWSEVIINFVKNAFAYAIPVAMLQFLVQPMVAYRLGEENNGLFLAILALNYFVINITAGVLMQTRLLQQEKYSKLGVNGDFSFLLLVMAVVTVFVMMIGSSIYMKSFSLKDNGAIILVAVLFLIHDYVNVQYRVELDFTRILISNIVLSCGYIVGTIFFIYVLPYWPVIFLIAYGIAEVYDLTHTTYWRESIQRTELFNDTIKRYMLLAGASVMGHFVSYADRMILYPVTDGTTVSIFTSAGIMGKMVMLLSTPLSAFLLSYMVREEKLQFKIPRKAIFFGVGMLLIGYLCCVGLSYSMLNILYPKWALQSFEYVPITTAVSIMNLIATVFNVIIIRFCHSKWQIAINTCYIGTYFLFSFLLLHFYGLYGFCVGNLLSVLIKLSMMFVILKKVSSEDYIGKV